MAELYPVTSATPKGLGRGAVSKAHEVFAFPAPTLGMDVRQAFASSNPQTAITIENCFARSYGLEMRAGYTRWALLPSGVEAVTLMPYVGPDADATSRLFAAGSDGHIYDVTVEDYTTPKVSVKEIPGQTNPGDAHWLNFVTEGGNFLIVIFPGAGYWTYEAAAGWVEYPAGTGAGKIEGVDPLTFVYAFAWENRLWFVEGGTGKAWYLPVNQLAGKAEMFDFGSMFTHGGELSVGCSWTVDGGGDGGGMSDSLVLIGSEGDVLIYGGEDPTDAQKFHINGRWFVGRVPTGRRYVSRYGSNMAVLSERGLLLMTDILRGDGENPQKEAAARVNQVLQPQIRNSLDAKYWEVKILPDANVLIVNVPVTATVNDTMWAFDQNSFGASLMTEFPFTTVEMFKSQSYASDAAGNVWKLWTGNSDGAIGNVKGTDLQAKVQTSFVSLGDAGRWKRFIMARAGFRATTAPAVSIAINSDWSFTLPVGAPPFLGKTESEWNAALWDVGVWGGGFNTYKAWVGVAGMGHYASFVTTFKGAAGTIFADWDCVVESGGIL